MTIENTHVIVIGETSKGELASHAYELGTLAKRIGSESTLVVSASEQSGLSAEDAAQKLGNVGISNFHVVSCGTSLSGSAIAKYVANLHSDLESQNKRVIVLGPQTYLGRDIVAHLSVALNRPLLANAIDIENTEEGIVATHTVFGGTKIVKAITSGDQPYLALVRPKSIVVEETSSQSAVITTADASSLIETSEQTQIINSESIESVGPELEDAAIVISGGRGLGSKENYENLVQGCADVLGAATGASRAIVDAGWVPYSKQVGQTGKTVKPDVYIACGVSGATQHLVGMKGSKNIIAINTDDQAPIFSVADLGVVADVNVVMPQLIEKLKAKKA